MVSGVSDGREVMNRKTAIPPPRPSFMQQEAGLQEAYVSSTLKGVFLRLTIEHDEGAALHDVEHVALLALSEHDVTLLERGRVHRMGHLPQLPLTQSRQNGHRFEALEAPDLLLASEQFLEGGG